MAERTIHFDRARSDDPRVLVHNHTTDNVYSLFMLKVVSGGRILSECLAREHC